MTDIHVDEDLCKGCGLCVLFCPQKVFEPSEELNKKGVFPPKVVRGDQCVECRLCELICPDFAISVTKDEELEEDTHGHGKSQERVRAQSAV
ncbi:MAG: 4Fe-4S binding protein [Theionarchaea archaeon]|nr:4Fe-4S binding protein [Theionarchaea archaeon]MBU7000517.1 4Fe-4S binding protein [Theionarchaea archaeon]MBU7021560.1 4Fe-4S binding protein [Theionarchaea archaeon]MBU7034091.1 4Fe-4S binding protein [Theionarchaea archaeon]MBU7039930.1 4Fe-4S binding protein [Theionarchaea archaeon]